ncbi:hypothetical protein STVA_05070 [Allostella vacuolata]|nr:hypothetical protein STVA_05070 [Stella vacuolata]
MLAGILVAAPGDARAQLLSQQVRTLNGEMKSLREQVDGLGRQLEARAQELAVLGIARREADQSLRDWFAESMRRTERVEEMVVAGDRQLAVAAATAEATLRTLVQQMAERLGGLEKGLAGLAAAGQSGLAELAQRLDRDAAARAREQGETSARLDDRINEAVAALGRQTERMGQDVAGRFQELSAVVASLQARLEQAEAGLAARVERLEQGDAERERASAAAGAALKERLEQAAAVLASRVERLEQGDAERERASAAAGAALKERLEQAAAVLASRVERLEQGDAERGRASAAAGEALTQRLEQTAAVLAQRLERLEQAEAGRADSPTAVEVGALHDRIDQATVALAERLEQLERADRTLGPALAAAASEARALIEQARAEFGGRIGSQGEALTEVARRVERLDREEVARAEQVAAVTAEIQSLVERTRTALAQRIDGIDRKAAGQAEAMEAAAAELRRSLTQVAGELAQRVDRVEQETAAASQQRATMSDARLERLLGASVHLSAIAQTARPFARELAYVRQIGEGVRGVEGPINELLVHAARGAPTIVDLRHSFESLAPAVVARSVARDEGWTGTARRWAVEAGSRFGVVDAPPPTAARAAVQNAELHLARGQLAQAVAALAPLDAAALSQAATWIIHARSRIAIDQAATELVNRVMAQVLTR